MSSGWEELLAQLFADAGLWDEGVEAARNACVAGAPLAAAAITAAAWYDNPMSGGRALAAAQARFAALPLEVGAWREALRPAPHPETGDPDFVAGFGFVSDVTASALLRGAERLRSGLPGGRLAFYLEHRTSLQRAAGAALNAVGLCALVFADAGVDDDQAERRYLLLRLEPALAAAQRARRAGLAGFPFFEEGYRYEGRWPAATDSGPCAEATLTSLKREVGLE
ncbi:MAG TPA: hypothetical protein VFZ61_05765 [Polyangiales bacterium]